MWPFSRKERARLDTFCREFYDKYIFNPPAVAGVDVGRQYCDVVRRSIAEVDPRFATVIAERFYCEITLVRFEIFGIAWIHNLATNTPPRKANSRSATSKSGGKRTCGTTWSVITGLSGSPAPSDSPRRLLLVGRTLPSEIGWSPICSTHGALRVTTPRPLRAPRTGFLPTWPGERALLRDSSWLLYAKYWAARSTKKRSIGSSQLFAASTMGFVRL
jgi:hypothetical protein